MVPPMGGEAKMFLTDAVGVIAVVSTGTEEVRLTPPLGGDEKTSKADAVGVAVAVVTTGAAEG